MSSKRNTPDYRSLLLAILRDADRPLTSYELYAALKAQHNLILISERVRYYLDRLAAQGQVSIDRSNPKRLTFAAVREEARQHG